MPNRLAGETSPYLLQHAQNPVDWFPWGEEALALARREGRLIFLSIGYSACHWCHVMEHESFEDPGVAEELNRSFVSIKVDREERPDIDEIYMAATMLFSGGHGGWPMSVFLTPDLEPVFAGTYFPPRDAHGRPGFMTVLRYLSERWSADRGALVADAGRAADAVRSLMVPQSQPSALPGGEYTERAASAIHRAFDHSSGGIASQGNKFPQSLSLQLLLRAFQTTGEARFREAVELTIEHMSQGGIYDHLGGGLHRYATDPEWLVPHFEKMLYDQALVVLAILDAWQASGDDGRRRLFAARVRGICDYVLRELTSPDGAFYSSEDADSEGQEGKFYVWTRAEVESALNARDAALFCSHYDVSEHGNWMHPGDAHVPHGPKNVLQVVREADILARLDGVAVEAVRGSLERARRTLFERRERRPRPALDDKVLTGWNGLMVAALARAAAVLDEPRYGEAAVKAADFILREVSRDGRLLTTHSRGRSHLAAYSTDYAFMVWGLVSAYEWDADPRHLLDAERLTDTLVEHYWDADGGGFFLTPSDHEPLLVRSKTSHDGATPSANSVMALALQPLAVLLDRPDYRQKAGVILEAFLDSSARSVFQQELLCCALDAWHRGWDEIVLVGPDSDPRMRAMLAQVHGRYLPNKVVVREARPDLPGSGRIGPLAGKDPVNGLPTVYFCRDGACQLPITDPERLFRAD